MSYEQKIQAKIEYAENKAEQLKQDSDAFFSKGFCERTGIPMGQPILVGHHSENRHRNTIKRYESQMRKHLDAHEKAEYYMQRAERLRNNKVISSDDPKAITKLQEKIKVLEEKRQSIKTQKKEGKEFPWYTLPYISRDIRRLTQRIEILEEQQQIENIEEETGDITLKVDKEDNRVKLFFPGKPSLDTRTKLKGNGFHWSRYNGCWQRMISDWAISSAREIISGVEQK